MRSDCVVGFYEPKLLCKLCDREGHTQISCDYAASKVGPNMSYADSAFWQFLILLIALRAMTRQDKDIAMISDNF